MISKVKETIYRVRTGLYSCKINKEQINVFLVLFSAVINFVHL